MRKGKIKNYNKMTFKELRKEYSNGIGKKKDVGLIKRSISERIKKVLKSKGLNTKYYYKKRKMEIMKKMVELDDKAVIDMFIGKKEIKNELSSGYLKVSLSVLEKMRNGKSGWRSNVRYYLLHCLYNSIKKNNIYFLPYSVVKEHVYKNTISSCRKYLEEEGLLVTKSITVDSGHSQFFYSLRDLGDVAISRYGLHYLFMYGCFDSNEGIDYFIEVLKKRKLRGRVKKDNINNIT